MQSVVGDKLVTIADGCGELVSNVVPELLAAKLLINADIDEEGGVLPAGLNPARLGTSVEFELEDSSTPTHSIPWKPSIAPLY